MLVLAGVGGFFTRMPAPENSVIPDGPALVALLAGIGLLLGLAIYGWRLAMWRHSVGLPLPVIIERMLHWEESAQKKEIEVWTKYASGGMSRWVIRRGVLPAIVGALTVVPFVLFTDWLSGHSLEWDFLRAILVLFVLEGLLVGVFGWYRMRRRYGRPSRAAG
jgi:hypothetical protein